MVAWIIAGSMLLLALACVVWAQHLRRERTYWMRRTDDADRAVCLLREECEQQQGAVSLAAAATRAGARLHSPVRALRQQQRALGNALQHYRGLVEAYDAAVQYCLQPVDLLPGAEGDMLERLIQHVREARRRLFAARTDLLNSAPTQALTSIVDDGKEALAQVDGLAAALCRFGADDSAGTTVDVNDWLTSALLLVEAQLPEGVRVIRRLEVLPQLPSAPWLGCVLLRLLGVAATAAGKHGKLIARTRYLQRHIEVHIMGHADVASVDALAHPQAELESSLQALQQQLGCYGAALQMMPAEGHGNGFVLSLPVRCEALAA